VLLATSHVSQPTKQVESTRRLTREQAHSYQYSFAPNPNWSNLYAPGSEIQKYLEDIANKYGATRFIKTSHEVKHCAWDEEKKIWCVDTAGGDLHHYLLTVKPGISKSKTSPRARRSMTRQTSSSLLEVSLMRSRGQTSQDLTHSKGKRYTREHGIQRKSRPGQPRRPR